MEAAPIPIQPITSYSQLEDAINHLRDAGVIDPVPATALLGAIVECKDIDPEYDATKVIAHLKQKFTGDGPVLADAGMALALGICIGVMLRSRF